MYFLFSSIKYGESMTTFMRRYITVKDDFVFIDIPFCIYGYDVDIFLNDIESVKDYKFPIIDVKNVELPNIDLIELLVTIHKIFERDSKTAIINASRNYKKLLKIYFLAPTFYIAYSKTDAMKYYKNYMFERLWR